MIELGRASVPPAKPQKAPTKATMVAYTRPKTSQTAAFTPVSVAAISIAVRRVTISKPTSAVTAPTSAAVSTVLLRPHQSAINT